MTIHSCPCGREYGTEKLLGMHLQGCDAAAAAHIEQLEQSAPALRNAEPVALVIDMPMRLPSASNLREHWGARQRRVKKQRAATALVLTVHRRRLSELAHGAFTLGLFRLGVTLVRVSRGTLDDDNLRGAFKAVRDQIAGHFALQDNDARIDWRYGQERGTAGIRIGFSIEPLARAA